MCVCYYLKPSEVEDKNERAKMCLAQNVASYDLIGAADAPEWALAQLA